TISVDAATTAKRPVSERLMPGSLSVIAGCLVVGSLSFIVLQQIRCEFDAKPCIRKGDRRRILRGGPGRFPRDCTSKSSRSCESRFGSSSRQRASATMIGLEE